MKFSLRDILKKTGAFIMICFVVLMIANKVMYTHIHKLEDGSIVVHAHPYDKAEDEDPGKEHHHVEAELFFLQSLGLLFFSALLTATLYFRPVVLELLSYNAKLINSSFILQYPGRAPPYC